MNNLAADQMQEMSAIALFWMFCPPFFNVEADENIPNIDLVRKFYTDLKLGLSRTVKSML